MYKRKRKFKLSGKSIIFIISTLIVIAILITGIVMLLTKGKEVEDALIDVPFSTDDSYFAVGNTIVYSDAEYLTCMDVSMNSKWRLEYFTSELTFTANDAIIAANSSDVLQVINAQGSHLFSIQLEGTIKATRVGTDKVAVAVDQIVKEETISYIIIFDTSGSSLYQIDISDKYVLDFGFDSLSDQLYILELDVSGAAPVSIISTYRPETQAVTGYKELKDQLVSSVYIIDGIIYSIGTNRLTMYTSLNSTDQEVLIYGCVLEDVYISDNPVFVYIPSTEDSDEIDIARVINTSGDETKINLPPNVFSIIHSGTKIYCFATNNIFVYTSEGKYLRTYALPFAIDGVERAINGYVFITEGENVFLLPLP